ncbi:molybdopterin biosynthesis protein [Desulfoprunum benzoelyticum]|uniref:Molybdopterin molybdenumtransferase n=1 Tax=Desulfoprunum benzoelyticum TaxID=1506996 RepID=A0A840UUJ8_9BACT|nr:molybdopterin biosynthesis protein [Desulfoprunum benzoelyticum]MBB5349365.1 putative molybdopterin biosynthesis protein [Desulfoprunum benzoelyticum]MBM9531060.1 molybdopterin biosynthesis protein [Desulfoprunum benzoelyticum]
MKRNIYLDNKPLDEAKAIWHQALADAGFFDRRPEQKIAVDDCLGRILARPVFALRSSPSYNAAAMDGIAVHFLDLANASESNPVRLGRARFTPVNTGNAIPEGCNAVVMIEDVHYLSDDEVELILPATPWQHVRTIGEDIVATELILPEGHQVRPIDQGAMLATGVTELWVQCPPKAIAIPTGSELIQPGQVGQPGQIIEFNSRILAGYLNEWGAVARRSAPIPDDPLKLKEAILAAVADNDIVILNAGASAGTRDYTSQVLAEVGKVIVHGVAIKPGKPVILAIVGAVPVIGLPGYPVSAVLTMRLFLRDMITAFLGREKITPPEVEATISRPFHSHMGVDEFVRVTLGRVGDILMATPVGKGAGAVMSLVRADGLLTIGAGKEGIGAGEKVAIELLRPQAEVDATLVCIGSHDNILDLLANQLHTERPLIRISSAHVGSMGGIMAIKRGEAHLAGTHLLDEATGEYNVAYIKRFLANIPLQLINLCYREQGLLVARGNPKNIQGFGDIAEHGHLFINRQGGAGTRLLTDKCLADLKIGRERIQGYQREEYTHMSVAAAIASGSADTGMGIRAAAVALDLDFVPVAEERYDLIIPKKFLHDDKITRVLHLIRTNQAFQQRILALGGYELRDSGKVMYEQG